MPVDRWLCDAAFRQLCLFQLKGHRCTSEGLCAMKLVAWRFIVKSQPADSKYSIALLSLCSAGTGAGPDRMGRAYGVGIFDCENIISAGYDLSKGLGIKASSGDKESGVDLNYRFENQ